MSTEVKVLTGFECTPYPDRKNTVADTSEHTRRYESDLRLLRDVLHIQRFRAPVEWLKIEESPGQYNWDNTDRYFDTCGELGLEPIADICHHSANPSWLEGGFANPDFPDALLRFVEAFLNRYPQIKSLTPINEIKTTATFGCKHWNPHIDNYLLMAKHMCQAVCKVSPLLAERGVKLYQTEPAEHVQPLTPSMAEVAQHVNNVERFLVLDLMLGQIKPGHPKFARLLETVCTPTELQYFIDHPAQIGTLALDYYFHMEGVLSDQPETPLQNPCILHEVQGRDLPARGMAAVVMDYVDRYMPYFPHMKFGVGEFNAAGTGMARTTALKYGLSEAEKLQEILGERFDGFCWYPAIDSRDWCNLVTRRDMILEPTGLIYADAITNERVPGELAQLLGLYVQGLIGVADIPAYEPERFMFAYPRPRFDHLMTYDWIPQYAHKQKLGVHFSKQKTTSGV